MEAAQRRAAQLLQEVLRGSSLAKVMPSRVALREEDAALVQELLFGSLRWWGRLDALARRLFHKKPPRVAVRCLLAVALYQLTETTAPPFAVVDQAVRAAEHAGLGGAKGLINAVLREFLRTREHCLAAVDLDEEARFSFPGWWITRLKHEHPAQWAALLEACNARPPLTLRVNTRRCSQARLLAQFADCAIDAQAVGEAGVVVLRPQPVAGLPGFLEGWFSVQDAGAQHAAVLLDPAPGMRVLDACAAPGGKTTHLLERSDCEVLALDAESDRLPRLRENLARLGLGASVRCGDARSPVSWWDGRPYDRILADVPCSSSGVVRRHPDIKWLRREGDLRELARLQKEILEALWPLLAKGGRLLYATCSVFRAENQEQVARFLDQHGEARLCELAGPELKQGQLLPVARDAAHNHDGFFYALLEKT